MHDTDAVLDRCQQVVNRTLRRLEPLKSRLYRTEVDP